jgi:hypothetical protein
MGLYNTIEDIQVKCFTVPANILIESDNGFELKLNVSGGKLYNYGVGSEVPYASPLYNYGKNFAIMNYMTFDEEPRVIFIIDGRVSEVISVKEVTQDHLNAVGMFIDNYGEKLKIFSPEDIVNISPDYNRLSVAYNNRIEEIRIERGLPNVYSNEFRIAMESMDIDELKKILANHETVLDDAFDETMKLFYDKYYNHHDTYHMDDTGVGIVYASLKENYYTDDNKKMILKLFKDKEYSDEMFKKYLDWAEDNPTVNKDDVLKIFELI